MCLLKSGLKKVLQETAGESEVSSGFVSILTLWVACSESAAEKPERVDPSKFGPSIVLSNLIISVWNTYSGFSVFLDPELYSIWLKMTWSGLFLTVLERSQNKKWQAQANIFQCKALSELQACFKKKNPLNISSIVGIRSMYYNIKPNFDTKWWKNYKT